MFYLVSDILMPIFNFTPFPILTTDRLVLRQAIPNDAAQIHYLRSDDLINQFIPTRKKSESVEDAAAFIENKRLEVTNNKLIYWAISLKDNPQLIGTICLWNLSQELSKGELGYDLSSIFQGKGIMSEAVKKVVQFGFDNMNLEIIEAYTQNNNMGSIRLLEKNNFLWDENSKDKMNDRNMIFVLKRSNHSETSK